MSEWLEQNSDLLWWLLALSIATLVFSALAVPVVVARLPANYFAHARRDPRRRAARHPVLVWILLCLRNLVGWVFILAGIAMLVLPGQGILTLVLGLTLIDFPGKYGLEQRLVSVPAVRKALNWIRRKAGRPPFEI